MFTATTRLILKSLGKTILWMLGNGFYGLAPFLFVAFLYAIGINNNATLRAHHEFVRLINDGFLIYFCCALMGASAVDIFFARKKFGVNSSFVILFIGSSIIVIFLVIAVYLVLLYSGPKELNYKDLTGFQAIIAIVSLIFSILAKTILNYKENSENHAERP